MSPLQQLLIVGAAVSTVLAAPVIPNAEPACEPLPHGHGLIPRPDTAEAFQSFPAFSLAATSATTPVGYIQAYSNLVTTFNEPSQFLRYFNLGSYDVNKCAAECGKDDKCNIFGVFFERTPMYKPGPKCPNPSSSTMIKCTLWSGTMSPKTGINNGQTREQFRIVMAGSNAYVKDITFSNKKDGSSNILKNWVVEKYQNGAAIQVPLDCNGVDTYMGMAAWRDGKFDAQRCLDACKVAGDTDIQSRKCRFVNTYVQRRNGVQVAQHCAMFSEYWPAPFATNLGQRRGDIEISQTDSYGLRQVEVKGTACYKPQDLLVPVPLRSTTIPDVPFVSTPAPVSASPSPSKPATLPVIPTPASSSPIPPKAQVSATGIQSQTVASSKLQSEISSLYTASSASIAVSAKAPTSNTSAPTSVASIATAKVSGTPSVVPSTLLSTPAAPSKAQVTSSGTPAILSRVSDTPSTVLSTSSILPATSAVVPSMASVGPATASIVSNAPSVVPNTSSAVSGNSSVAQATSSVVPATPSVLPAAPSVAPSSVVVPEPSSVALSLSSQLPSSSSVTPSTTSVLPAIPSNTLSTPTAALAISSTAPLVVPATPSSPLNTSSAALVTPSKPSASSSAAQSIPPVLSATPSSTPSTSLLSSATPTTPSPPPPPSASSIDPSNLINPVGIYRILPTSMPPIEPRRSAIPDSPSTLSVHFTASSPHSPSPSSLHPTSPVRARLLARNFEPKIMDQDPARPHFRGYSKKCWLTQATCWWSMRPDTVIADPHIPEEKFDPNVDELNVEKHG